MRQLALSALVAGLLVCAVGIVAMVEASLGLGSWAVLQQGISRHSPLSLGVTTIVVSVVVVGVALILGAQIGIGTLADAFLLGVFIDLLMRVRWVQDLAAAALIDRA